MMRFDLTCNIALRTETGQDLQLHPLPAQTDQQQLLHEVLWVDGCERWAVTPRADGERVLNLIGCQRQVRVAFAVSLTVTPVWCHAAALWAQPDAPIAVPRDYTLPGALWSAQRIMAALGPRLRGPAAVFAALPELFDWLQHVDASTLTHGPERPLFTWLPERIPETLHLAVAVFRTLGVPARIAVGFAPESESPVRHDARGAYLELYAGGRWWLFEPNGGVPAFGFIRTAVRSDPIDLALVEAGSSAQTVRMDANVDPPPAWGLPLRTTSRLLLSLDGRESHNPQTVQTGQTGADTASALARASA